MNNRKPGDTGNFIKLGKLLGHFLNFWGFFVFLGIFVFFRGQINATAPSASLLRKYCLERMRP